MTYVHVTRRGGALWARLDRPERANALGPEVMDGLAAWLDRAAGDADLSALVVTGTGRAFCPGADVRASAELGNAQQRLEFLADARALVDRIAAAPVPVIAAVNGAAFAGGLELVLACDLVIASETAVFGDLHLPHGRVPAWGGSARLVRAVGAARASRMLLLGERFTAEQMAAFGRVPHVGPAPDRDEAVDRVTAVLEGHPPQALRDMTRLLRAVRDVPTAEALEREWQVFEEHFAGDGDPGTVTIRP